ncbi:MAG: FtsX-like permease family protein [Pseudomonadota bacterium]
MSPTLLRIAIRDLRGGLAGFRVFLVCLILGVAGIAAVGSISQAISSGLAAEGREILGGDVSVSLTYRAATPEERAWFEAQGDLSEIADLRSMISRDDTPAERALSQVKGVDDLWPLFGAADTGGAALADLLAERGGFYGLITEPVLADRLGLEPGDRVRLGTATFEYRGRLMSEPDAASQGFNLGPRTVVSLDGLRAAGLLETGTIFDMLYRLRIGDAPLEALRADFQTRFPESGARWRDHRNAAPGIERLVDRLGAFLILVGLAALAIGGVGIGAAVRGYLNRKTKTIAALRTLGATGSMVFSIYLLQVAVISLIGIALGLALGAGAVALAGPLLADQLPVPAVFGVYLQPLMIAAVFGAITAIVFTIWPLAWLRDVRPATLFREMTSTDALQPGRWMVAVLFGLLIFSTLVIIGLSEAPELAFWVLVALFAAFICLRSLGAVLAILARRWAHLGILRRRPGWRLALGAIGAPSGQTPGVVVALGLALGVIAAIGQIDANLQRLIRDQLPTGSPAFFFVDIQTNQLAGFEEILAENGADRTDTASMLRGVITQLNGITAREAPIDPAAAWVLRGDRGVSYAAAKPPEAVLTEGEWWSEDYSGEPLVSFAEEEGRELGLSIGSTVTISILGRPITARVANFRKVEWRGMGINFLIILNPGALAGAPHTHIATVHTPPASEASIMREIGKTYPNITVIRVRDQVERVATALGDLGSATRWAALAVLITGLAVLIGAAAASADRQVHEAAILRTLGASRSRVLSSFALRALLLGSAAGLVALVWGSVTAWAVSTYVFDAEFELAPRAAIITVAAGALLNLLAATGFAAKALNQRPARVLRTAAG